MESNDKFLDLKARIGAILKDDDKARMAFDREVAVVEKWHQREISNKCTYSFIAGAIISAIIYGFVFFQMNGAF